MFSCVCYLLKNDHLCMNIYDRETMNLKAFQKEQHNDSLSLKYKSRTKSSNINQSHIVATHFKLLILKSEMKNISCNYCVNILPSITVSVFAIYFFEIDIPLKASMSATHLKENQCSIIQVFLKG